MVYFGGFGKPYRLEYRRPQVFHAAQTSRADPSAEAATSTIATARFSPASTSAHTTPAAIHVLRIKNAPAAAP